jgi:hypothetical protein
MKQRRRGKIFVRHVEDTKRKGKKNGEDFVLKMDENKVEKEETRRR